MVFLYIIIGIAIIAYLVSNYFKDRKILLLKQMLQSKNELDKQQFQDDLDKAKQEYENKLQEYQIQQNKKYEQYCKDLEEKKKLQQEKITIELQGLRESKEKELLGALACEIRDEKHKQLLSLNSFTKDCQDQKQKLQEEINSITNQLAELRSARELTIQSYKKEQEILQKQNYYKINLADTAKEDIQILLSIEPRLANKEALNKLIYDVFIKQPLNEMLFRVLGDKDTCGIYKITHIPSQQVYIGQSVNIRRRWASHVKSAYHIGDIAHQKIHDAMAKEGIDNFTFEVLEETTKNKLNEREKYWINYYKSYDYGYNNTKGNN